MKEYHVARLTALPDWDKIEKATVDTCPWGGSYRPATFAQMAYLEGEGFYVRMSCAEAAPRAVYTQPDDPVCQDSCLECFVDFDPGAGIGYLNLEANANGALLLALGTQREGRRPVRSLGCVLPTLQAFRQGEHWGWQAFLPLEMVRALYPGASFAPGAVLRGNFYKCGDKTAIEHYCVWNPIQAPQPDYHRPECFGALVLD